MPSRTPGVDESTGDCGGDSMPAADGVHLVCELNVGDTGTRYGPGAMSVWFIYL